jgi:hypothetical protein
MLKNTNSGENNAPAKQQTNKIIIDAFSDLTGQGRWEYRYADQRRWLLSKSAIAYLQYRLTDSQFQI